MSRITVDKKKVASVGFTLGLVSAVITGMASLESVSDGDTVRATLLAVLCVLGVTVVAVSARLFWRELVNEYAVNHSRY